jgi:hypothetical protein
MVLLGGLRHHPLVVLADEFLELDKIILSVQPLRGLIGQGRGRLVLVRSVQRVLKSRFEL